MGLVFVFGSNDCGHHGAGAARTALLHYGAVNGIGEGLRGWSYALPTMWAGRPFRRMTLAQIQHHVDVFINFARANPQLEFGVTQIGCGLGGQRPSDIAPMFASAPQNCLFDTAWKSFLPGKRFWGTYP